MALRRTRKRPPRVDVTMLSPFKSDRSGRIEIIVVHATESGNAPGLSDLKAIGGWFQNPDAQVSSHICTDGDGNTARYVYDLHKAWHCAGYNSVSLGIEQIGHASQKTWPKAQLKKTAQWIAWWSIKYGIPIQHSTSHGVCRHSDLGSKGGNHDDPGAGYDLARVLRYARWYRRWGWPV